MVDEDWVSFSLTHVKYPRGDPIGYILALLSLTPFAVFIAFVTLVLFKKELDTVLFVSGQLLNELINLILKHVIREARPDMHSVKNATIKTFGMPSQHSQFMAFFTFYCILFIMIRMQHKPWYFRYPIPMGLSISLLAVVYSRVYLLYHYWFQVVVGILVGFSWAAVWFYFVYSFFEPKFFNLIIQL